MLEEYPYFILENPAAGPFGGTDPQTYKGLNPYGLGCGCVFKKCCKKYKRGKRCKKCPKA
ncbi:hypothetical protein [Parapedobacter sp. DT-150]|uniref:hypothetical protein n=1 Tax=Parapedobacter sp. DT-150 TaxID=3396162 RepID=UPI003F1BD8E1